MRNVLEEFRKGRGQRKPTILGLREHIFTGRSALLQYPVLNYFMNKLFHDQESIYFYHQT